MIEMSIAWHEKSLENQMQVLIKLRRESDNAAFKYQASDEWGFIHCRRLTKQEIEELC